MRVADLLLMLALNRKSVAAFSRLVSMHLEKSETKKMVVHAFCAVGYISRANIWDAYAKLTQNCFNTRAQQIDMRHQKPKFGFYLIDPISSQIHPVM